MRQSHGILSFACLMLILSGIATAATTKTRTATLKPSARTDEWPNLTLDPQEMAIYNVNMQDGDLNGIAYELRTPVPAPSMQPGYNVFALWAWRQTGSTGNSFVFEVVNTVWEEKTAIVKASCWWDPVAGEGLGNGEGEAPGPIDGWAKGIANHLKGHLQLTELAILDPPDYLCINESLDLSAWVVRPEDFPWDFREAVDVEWEITPSSSGTFVPSEGHSVTFTPLETGEVTITATVPGTDGPITESITFTILKVDITPTWDIVTEGSDSDDFEAVVTPPGLSGLTYSWSWEAIVAGGGNNPSVTFSSSNSSTTHVDQAHWYAVPDARCASNQVSEYRLWCTVSIGGVSCSNSATMSAQLVDPAAETVPEYNLTGGPSIAFNAASNWWYVSGTGTLTRQVTLTTNWWLHGDSEFTAKIQAHENQHSQDLVNGFDGHEFVTVAEFYARISTLTDPTSPGLVNKISQEYVQYMTDEGTELSSLLDGLEVRAYNVSDGVAPDYYYSNCGRFTYP